MLLGSFGCSLDNLRNGKGLRDVEGVTAVDLPHLYIQRSKVGV
jgi:hypothetical protein